MEGKKSEFGNARAEGREKHRTRHKILEASMADRCSEGYLLPHGDVDDDEEQQGERGDPTANDESHGREQCLVHVLQRGDRTTHAS